MNYFETNLEEISRSIQLLAQIFEYQVFELQVEEKDGNQTGYVPYMMNDAIECYLSFHGLRISGKYDKDYEGEMWAQLEEREGRYGLIVHQGEESVLMRSWNIRTVTGIMRSDISGEMELSSGAS